MALEQLELETGRNKVEAAIELLKAWEPEGGYYLGFSGGKDSVVIYDLAVKAGVKFDAHYCVSPIDPPPIFDFIKTKYPEIIWDYHAKGFWKTVVKKGLPFRKARWCCKVIKEGGGQGRVKVLGMRRDEGGGRRNYCSVTYIKNRYHTKREDTVWILPIVGWGDYDVWQYIRENELPYCSLYDEGFKRLGCVLCPFSRNVEMEMKYIPKIAALWRRAADRIVERWETKGTTSKHKGKTGEELFLHWIKRD